MDCPTDAEEHYVYHGIHHVGRFRRKTNQAKGARILQMQPDTLAAELGMGRVYLRDLLVGLEDLGLIWFFREDSTIGYRAPACQHDGEALAFAVGRARTSLGVGDEEGGKWEEFQGPKVPTARNAREASRGKKVRKTASEIRREKREARLDRILKKRASEWNSNDLAMIFSHRLYQTDVFAWSGVGATNHKALAANIAAWLREGGSPELIREMIEAFVGDRHLIRAGDLPWRAFINSRAILAQRAERSLGVADGDLGWVESETFLHADVDLGWGESEDATTDSRYEDG